MVLQKQKKKFIVICYLKEIIMILLIFFQKLRKELYKLFVVKVVYGLQKNQIKMIQKKDGIQVLDNIKLIKI